MPSTLSPNMSLILPTVGQEPGPNWALDLNNSLSTIDQHDHASGSGVQITPAGMNINTDLDFGGNNALNLRSIRMNSQLAPLALGSDINCIYVTNGELFYNDNVGNQVQITAAGAVNGTPGSIGNLIAPAAVTYVPGTQTFVFESNQTNATPGSLDAGNLYIRNIVAGGNYIQIQPNAVLPASYSLTLPSALPASSKIVRLDNLGNLSATLDIDNSSIEISSNTLQVKDLGITTAKLNNLAVTTAKIDNAAVTQSKLANNSVGTAQIIDANVTEPKVVSFPYLLFNSNYGPNYWTGGIFNNFFSGTITISNPRNLLILVQPRASGNQFYSTAAPSTLNVYRILITGPSGTYYAGFDANGVNLSLPGSTANTPTLTQFVRLPDAGTYTVAMQGSAFGDFLSITNYQMLFQVMP